MELPGINRIHVNLVLIVLSHLIIEEIENNYDSNLYARLRNILIVTKRKVKRSKLHKSRVSLFLWKVITVMCYLSRIKTNVLRICSDMTKYCLSLVLNHYQNN